MSFPFKEQYESQLPNPLGNSQPYLELGCSAWAGDLGRDNFNRLTHFSIMHHRTQEGVYFRR